MLMHGGVGYELIIRARGSYMQNEYVKLNDFDVSSLFLWQINIKFLSLFYPPNKEGPNYRIIVLRY